MSRPLGRQDNSDNTKTSSELLPGKPIKVSDKANRKVLEMPKKRVSCQKKLPAKLHEDIEMEGKDTRSRGPTKRAGPQRPGEKGRKFTRFQQGKKEENADQWTEMELQRLHEAVTSFPKHINNFWVNVAMVVGTRSAEECQEQYNAHAPTKSTKKNEVLNGSALCSIFIHKICIKEPDGTLKRKQQVRNLLDHMPKDDHNDIFNSSPMQNNKWVKVCCFSTWGANVSTMLPFLGSLGKYSENIQKNSKKTPHTSLYRYPPKLLNNKNISQDIDISDIGRTFKFLLI
uniref:Myb-like domain-containing protein n=1 Tax=Oncorhynchus mykiss TaxID=8022 RepID=A0A8K9UED3_ONCMY